MRAHGKFKAPCVTRACRVTHVARQCLPGPAPVFSPRCGVAKHQVTDSAMCQECRFAASALVFVLDNIQAQYTAPAPGAAVGPRVRTPRARATPGSAAASAGTTPAGSPRATPAGTPLPSDAEDEPPAAAAPSPRDAAGPPARRQRRNPAQERAPFLTVPPAFPGS